MTTKLICDACKENEALGVAAVPGVPMSVAYCRECLQANSHPMYVLIGNTACCGGLDNTVDEWQQMVMCSLHHQDKTLEWFNEEVRKSIEKEAEDDE